MRMRAYVHALARHKLHRPEMIEEDEGADHLPPAVRQRAAHLESIAEVTGARHDHQFQRVAGFGIAEHGIVVGKPAHWSLRKLRADDSTSTSFRPSRRLGAGRRPTAGSVRARTTQLKSHRPAARRDQLVTPISIFVSSSGAIT